MGLGINERTSNYARHGPSAQTSDRPMVPIRSCKYEWVTASTPCGYSCKSRNSIRCNEIRYRFRALFRRSSARRHDPAPRRRGAATDPTDPPGQPAKHGTPPSPSGVPPARRISRPARWMRPAMSPQWGKMVRAKPPRSAPRRPRDLRGSGQCGTMVLQPAVGSRPGRVRPCNAGGSAHKMTPSRGRCTRCTLSRATYALR